MLVVLVSLLFRLCCCAQCVDVLRGHSNLLSVEIYTLHVGSSALAACPNFGPSDVLRVQTGHIILELSKSHSPLFRVVITNSK